jgi:hypothetical protein
LYPNEPVRIHIEGRKVTSSIKAALYTNWGQRQARTHFHKKQIVPMENFNLVYWDGLRWALQTYPKSLCFLWSQTVSWSQMVSNLLGVNLNIDAKTLPPLQKTYFLSSKTHKVQKTLKHQSYGSKTLNQSTFSLPPKKSSPLPPVQRAHNYVCNAVICVTSKILSSQSLPLTFST